MRVDRNSISESSLIGELRFWISLRIFLSEEETESNEIRHLKGRDSKELILKMAMERFDTIVSKLNMLKDEYFNEIIDRVNQLFGITLDRNLSIEVIKKEMAKGTEPQSPRDTHPWIRPIEEIMIGYQLMIENTILKWVYEPHTFDLPSRIEIPPCEEITELDYMGVYYILASLLDYIGHGYDLPIQLKHIYFDALMCISCDVLKELGGWNKLKWEESFKYSERTYSFLPSRLHEIWLMNRFKECGLDSDSIGDQSGWPRTPHGP